MMPMPARMTAGSDVMLHFQVRDANGRFRKGDLVAYTEKWDARVDAKGTVNLPLVGEVSVVGKTVSEAQKAIEGSYRDGRYLRNPQVMRDQARLAHEYGIGAFCFYFYCFSRVCMYRSIFILVIQYSRYLLVIFSLF